MSDSPYSLLLLAGIVVSLVLWTRLAPLPFEPSGGMPAEAVEVRWERAMWNDSEPARRTATLIVEPLSGERCSVSATVGDGFEGSVGDVTSVVYVLGTPGPELKALLDDLAL